MMKVYEKDKWTTTNMNPVSQVAYSSIASTGIVDKCEYTIYLEFGLFFLFGHAVNCKH